MELGRSAIIQLTLSSKDFVRLLEEATSRLMFPATVAGRSHRKHRRRFPQQLKCLKFFLDMICFLLPQRSLCVPIYYSEPYEEERLILRRARSLQNMCVRHDFRSQDQQTSATKTHF